MADKTLKSLNFGGADNYFPLPLVTAADNDKILSVVNGEWDVIDFPGNSGEYVWSRQYAGSSVTGDFTGGTYTLTTTNDTLPSSEIEYSLSAPTYNIATKKWEMADSTIVTLTNADNTVPSFSGNMYVRLTSSPNVWYLATAINATGSGPYSKSLVYNAKYTADIDKSYVEYVAGSTEEKYPDGGWSDGFWYTLKLTPILPYLSFIGNEDFTLKTYNPTKNWDGTLEYSTDAITWNTWNGTEISSSGSKLYLRGTGNTKITGTTNSIDYRFVFTGTDALKIACKGNIENLLDYETVSAGGHPTMAEFCYSNMFYGCTSLTTTPELPATTLAGSCYRRMFQGCTALITAPALPATTLAVSCYNGMFYGCTSLAKAPALPATTLANGCYQYMFGGCTALTTTPELPATTLTRECYRQMFQGCTALITAPALPATTLDYYCYIGMFKGCTSLTTAPELPATTLAAFCYNSMFLNCASIKLSTTKTGEYQTAYRIPKSGTGTTATDALLDMFKGTGGTFTGTPEINTTYYLSTSNTVV